MTESIRIHHKMSASRTNGPGIRAVIWVQGCTLNCPGCFNPKTHDQNGGTEISVDELFNWILSLGDTIEGVSLSGGEPLQQIQPVLSFLQRVKTKTDLTTFLFSGYSKNEIQQFPQWPIFKKAVDVCICGRYAESQQVKSGIISSANQEVLFLSERYTQDDLDKIPENEIIIMPDGEILASGIGKINLD